MLLSIGLATFPQKLEDPSLLTFRNKATSRCQYLVSEQGEGEEKWRGGLWARGFPKAGAEPTADGIAETKRMVGTGVGSDVACGR